MCDAVPHRDVIALVGHRRGGKLLPPIGNTRPRRERSLGNRRYAAVIDCVAAHFSVRNPAPLRGTAIAPVLIMKCFHKSTLRLILLGLPAVSAAVTGPIADLTALQKAAEHAVRHEIPPGDSKTIVRVQSLDARLRLAECDQALTAAISGDGQVRAHTTVAVRCEGTVHWTIYMSVTIDSEFSVLVARHAMARDAELTATDFELMPRHLPGLTTDYVTQPAMVAGQRLRKTVAGGEALSLDALTPSNAIHRGQQVTLIAGAGGFEVRMSAVALTDGRIADRIRVQNLSSQRVIEGIVRSDSVVEVPL
jgi:flagella basal body P-ring formation protein FlgA